MIIISHDMIIMGCIYYIYIYTIIQGARQVAYKYGKQLCFSSLCRFEQETIEDLNTGRWLKNHLETYESMVFQDYPKYMKWTCYHSCSKAPTRIQKLKLLFNQLRWKKKSARIFLWLIMADPLETENR